MKKVISMIIAILVMAMGSVSAFAAEGVIGSSISKKLDESGKYWIVEETFEDGSKVIHTEEEVYYDDWIDVCPKCGKIHDGCCEEEAKRVHFTHYIDGDYQYLKFCDIKDNALYFVTPDNKLMLMNLKTNQLTYIADGVAGLSRMGMNGRFLSYVTLDDNFFSVPFEIGEDGQLSTDFQQEFGE